jgi:D-alanyl-lipoteichoic acid acyltransferase DltB (MBOAT superfamily)
MLFNSLIFVVFFICVFALYWTMARRRSAQNILLLAASYVFYGAWSWKFLLLLIASTLLDFMWGILIERVDQRRSRWFLIASIVMNLTMLATFKYLGFFVSETADLLASLGFSSSLPALTILLPIGISFYTFQSMAYTIDVYRKKIPAERNLIDFGLYIAFFPQLVAGPIERATHMLPQFKMERRWNAAALDSGLQLAVWGLFKKVVIADNLAPYVDTVYMSPAGFSGSALMTATVFFAFQIYCDFSGYTDTARGVARMLGFDLVRNFDHPYVSRNPVEFWQRWHISLSQWFQDYLYFPLAMYYMRKGGWGSRYKAHIISMTLIGFWHGASWTFIVFGFYWGVVIALYLFMIERSANWHANGRLSRALTAYTSALRAFALGVTFVIACVGWVFFRADSMNDAWYVLSHLFSSEGIPVVLRAQIAHPAVLWLLIGGLIIAEWLQRNRPSLVAGVSIARTRAIAWRYALVAAIIFSYLMAQQGSQPFIYFQF